MCTCVRWRLKRECEEEEDKWHLERDFERGGKKNKRKVGRKLDRRKGLHLSEINIAISLHVSTQTSSIK